jgi:uncharacterized radical SAM protein YgiQ
MDAAGWDFCDFIFVTGDAYVDHPSFAAALLCRVLEDAGYRVGIIPQPNWKDVSSYKILGKPRYAFLAGAGSMDSMVAHYTAEKRLRSGDAYSPDGKAGFRPGRCLLTYAGGIRQAYRGVPVIIGGIEASLRRFSHYDYWSDTVRRSVLLDSKADILVYGMGERPLLEIARRLAEGESAGDILDVRGTCVRVHEKRLVENNPQWKGLVYLPPFAEIKGNDEASLRAYAGHFMAQRANADPLTAGPLAEKNEDRFVIQNPPAFPLTTAELDRIYELPFTRRCHPMYETSGEGGKLGRRGRASGSTAAIPALKEVEFSLVSSRGCFGGCSFCSIAFHQGRAVTPRSTESLVREARFLAALAGFKGYIHDVGGPTANFYMPACKRQERGGFCAERECLYPRPCPHLTADHLRYMETLKALRELSAMPQQEAGNKDCYRAGACLRPVKKIFIRSGVRFDFIQLDKKHGREFLETLCAFHVSGQLKVAPEHVSAKVLDAMGKTGGNYAQFLKDYTAVNKKLGLKQYLLPYFISGHPGASQKEAEELAAFLRKTGFIPDQSQDFYPTPGTLSTAMYHTGLDPRTMEKIFVAKGKLRREQRALISKNSVHSRGKPL